MVDLIDDEGLANVFILLSRKLLVCSWVLWMLGKFAKCALANGPLLLRTLTACLIRTLAQKSNEMDGSDLAVHL